LEIVFAFVIGTAFGFWGAYQAAKRFPVVGSLVAVLLLVGAFFLVRLDLSPSSLGDGAPSGAGAALGLLLLIEFVSILLAGTLLLAGWRGRDHPLSKTLFLFLFLPFVVYAVVAAAPKSNRSAGKPVTRESGGVKQLDKWKEGYIWAIDSQFLSEEECKNDSPEFVVGCRQGVAKNRARSQR
jgi:hypothetical protein